MHKRRDNQQDIAVKKRRRIAEAHILIRIHSRQEVSLTYGKREILDPRYMEKRIMFDGQKVPDEIRIHQNTGEQGDQKEDGHPFFHPKYHPFSHSSI